MKRVLFLMMLVGPTAFSQVPVVVAPEVIEIRSNAVIGALIRENGDEESGRPGRIAASLGDRSDWFSLYPRYERVVTTSADLPDLRLFFQPDFGGIFEKNYREEEVRDNQTVVIEGSRVYFAMRLSGRAWDQIPAVGVVDTGRKTFQVASVSEDGPRPLWETSMDYLLWLLGEKEGPGAHKWKSLGDLPNASDVGARIEAPERTFWQPDWSEHSFGGSGRREPDGESFIEGRSFKGTTKLTPPGEETHRDMDVHVSFRRDASGLFAIVQVEDFDPDTFPVFAEQGSEEIFFNHVDDQNKPDDEQREFRFAVNLVDKTGEIRGMRKWGTLRRGRALPMVSGLQAEVLSAAPEKQIQRAFEILSAAPFKGNFGHGKNFVVVSFFKTPSGIYVTVEVGTESEQIDVRLTVQEDRILVIGEDFRGEFDPGKKQLLVSYKPWDINNVEAHQRTTGSTVFSDDEAELDAAECSEALAD